MQGITCPFCNKTMYSTYWEAGKVHCIHCHREFFVGYDELKEARVSTGSKSLIQAIF